MTSNNQKLVQDFWKRSKNPIDLKVKCTLPPVEHPIYGTKINATCEFPLCLSSDYPISNYFDLTSEEQEALLCSIISVLGQIYEPLDHMTIRKKLHLMVYTTACIMPQIDARGKLFEIGTAFCTIVYENDDTFERVAATYNTAYLTNLIANCQFSSNYLGSDSSQRGILAQDIVRQLPEMEAIAKTLCTTLDNICDIYQGSIPKGIKHFFVSHKRTMQGSLLKYNQNSSDNFSESTLAVVRGADVAGDGLLEIYALLQGCSVPKHIRKSLLFELLIQAALNFTATTNDMFGLLKDIKDEGAPTNVILRRAVHGKISLEESFELAGRDLNLAVRDMHLIMQKLENAFENDELRAYLRLVKDYCDGQILMYCLEADRYNYRYGGLNTEVVEDKNS